MCEKPTGLVICEMVAILVKLSSVALRVIRPYLTEEEYLEAEAWTFEARSMLLLDQGGIDENTVVVFDVLLQSGVRVVRAEAKVVGSVPGDANRPPALRVRFRRFDTKSKAFIERAVAIREQQLSLQPAHLAEPEVKPSRPPRRSARPSEASRPPPAPSAAGQPRSPRPSTRPVARPEGPSGAGAVRAEAATAIEPSGIHRRITPPPNREELLDRLRARRPRRGPDGASGIEATPSSHRERAG